MVIIAHINVVKERTPGISNDMRVIYKFLIATITTIKMTNMIVIDIVTLTISNQILIWATVAIIIVANGVVVL